MYRHHTRGGQEATSKGKLVAFHHPLTTPSVEALGPIHRSDP